MFQGHIFSLKSISILQEFLKDVKKVVPKRLTGKTHQVRISKCKESTTGLK